MFDHSVDNEQMFVAQSPQHPVEHMYGAAETTAPRAARHRAVEVSMAAIAIPVHQRRPATQVVGTSRGRGGVRPSAVSRASHATGPRDRHLRLVVSGAELAAGPCPRVEAGRRSFWGSVRRAGPGILTLGVLGAVWVGAGALVGSRPTHLVAPPGAHAVAGGYVYDVRPGDTVWSIASAMEPGADPRELVDEIASTIPGGVLRVGETLRLP
jgi:hypothetical protein